MRLIDWLKQLGKDKSAECDLSDASVLDFIRYLDNCTDCEQVFNDLDQYAESEIRKEDAARLMPLVHDHLETCSECCDEYEALLDVLAKASEKPEA
ncbi:MAG TPA: hypothetical protein VLM78_00020 [Anaerolineales bacterium]|nr:hypothetical protein [Anaerolineales bacterium]